MYDPKSKKAEEFIDDAESKETLRYAAENRNNIPLIESILEKAARVIAAAFSPVKCCSV